jgi:hypothetical protein
MLEYYDVVYDLRLKFYGRLLGNWDNRDHFNASERYFAVRPIGQMSAEVVERQEAGVVKCANKNLTTVKKGMVVVVKPEMRQQGEGLPLGVIKHVSDEYVTIYNGDDYDRVWFYELGELQAEGVKPEVFHRGDLVYLATERNYVGVVLTVNQSPYIGSHPSYKVAYFNKNTVQDFIERGLFENHPDTVVWPAWRLAACTEFKTPRIRLSPAAKSMIQRQYKANINSSNSKFSDRLNHRNGSAEFRRFWVDKYKAQGKILAGAFAAQERDDTEWVYANDANVANAFNDMNEMRRRDVFSKHDFGSWASDNSLLDWCGHCGAVEIYEEMNYSEDSSTSFCRRCEGDFVWSDYMDDYLLRNNTSPVYESLTAFELDNPDGFATMRWARYQDGWRIADNAIMNEDTYYEWDAEYNNDDDDYDDDDERDDATGGQLNGYHNSHRVWVEEWSDKSYIPIGVELEVYCEERYNAVKELRETFPKRMYLERDGSLDDDHGFEIVSQPYGKKEWTEFAPQMLNVLKKRGAVAWNDPAGQGYGIHINLNREYLSPLQETRMFMFLAAEENRDFITAIAQRENVYHPTLNMGQTEKIHQKVRNMGGLDTKDYRTNMYGQSIPVKKLVGRGKYAPMNMHTARVEIRIFQSTLNLSSFMKNLEFTWALVQWTNIKSSTGTSWLYQDFLRWLAKRPHVERDFPHLMAYLRKPKFDRRDSSRVSNTWTELLPKETRRSIPAEVLAKTPTEHVEDIYVPVITPAFRPVLAIAA